MKKRTVALLLVLMLVFGAAVGGTVAWLTSDDSVTNTFTYGDVEITLDEADVDENGDAIVDADRVKANVYHLLPGGEYDKDPTVHVAANSEDSLIYVVVENQIAAIEGDPTIADQMAANGWVNIDGTDVWYFETAEGANEGVTVGADGSVGKDTNLIVFESFTIADDVTGFDGYVADGEAGATAITVTAYAVQAENMTGTRAEIWNSVFATP